MRFLKLCKLGWEQEGPCIASCSLKGWVWVEKSRLVDFKKTPGGF